MNNIIIVGASGHAKVVIDAIEKQGNFKIVGLIDRFKGKGEYTFNYPILGAEEDIPEIQGISSINGGVVAIGDNWVRAKIVNKVKQLLPSFQFVKVIHPSSQIGRNVFIGEGTVVMAGVVINSDSKIGKHCIINTKASVDHDNLIGDFVTLAPNSTTGGNVKIGSYTAISLGSNIIHNIEIGEHTVIGAGATVVRNIPSYTVAFGTPAKIHKTRKEGDRYL